tara:strand:- start:7531 stop:11157 length:3627 start_codon:yes stop_codon:yes gene_type:complete
MSTNFDSRKEREKQYLAQQRASNVVRITPELSSLLNRREDPQDTRMRLLRIQDFQKTLGPTSLLVSKQKKRAKGFKRTKNLRGETARNLREQRRFERGERRERPEEEPRIIGEPVQGQEDPAITRERLRLQDLERQDRTQIENLRLAIEGRKINAVRDQQQQLFRELAGVRAEQQAQFQAERNLFGEAVDNYERRLGQQQAYLEDINAQQRAERGEFLARTEAERERILAGDRLERATFGDRIDRLIDSERRDRAELRAERIGESREAREERLQLERQRAAERTAEQEERILREQEERRERQELREQSQAERGAERLELRRERDIREALAAADRAELERLRNLPDPIPEDQPLTRREFRQFTESLDRVGGAFERRLGEHEAFLQEQIDTHLARRGVDFNRRPSVIYAGDDPERDRHQDRRPSIEIVPGPMTREAASTIRAALDPSVPQQARQRVTPPREPEPAPEGPTPPTSPHPPQPAANPLLFDFGEGESGSVETGSAEFRRSPEGERDRQIFESLVDQSDLIEQESRPTTESDFSSTSTEPSTGESSLSGYGRRQEGRYLGPDADIISEGTGESELLRREQLDLEQQLAEDAADDLRQSIGAGYVRVEQPSGEIETSEDALGRRLTGDDDPGDESRAANLARRARDALEVGAGAIASTGGQVIDFINEARKPQPGSQEFTGGGVLQTPEGETIFGLGIPPDYDDPTARQESRPTGPPKEPPPQQPAREPAPAGESEPLFPGGVPPFQYPETAPTAILGDPRFGLDETIETQQREGGQTELPVVPPTGMPAQRPIAPVITAQELIEQAEGQAQAPTEPPPGAVQPYILTAEDRAAAMRMLEEDFNREGSYLNLGKKPTHSGSGNRKKRAINRFYNDSLSEYQGAERSRQQFQQEETQFRTRSDEDLQRARREQQARKQEAEEIAALGELGLLEDPVATISPGQPGFVAAQTGGGELTPQRVSTTPRPSPSRSAQQQEEPPQGPVDVSEEVGPVEPQQQRAVARTGRRELSPLEQELQESKSELKRLALLKRTGRDKTEPFYEKKVRDNEELIARLQSMIDAEKSAAREAARQVAPAGAALVGSGAVEEVAEEEQELAAGYNYEEVRSSNTLWGDTQPDLAALARQGKRAKQADQRRTGIGFTLTNKTERRRYGINPGQTRKIIGVEGGQQPKLVLLDDQNRTGLARPSLTELDKLLKRGDLIYKRG